MKQIIRRASSGSKKNKQRRRADEVNVAAAVASMAVRTPCDEILTNDLHRHISALQAGSIKSITEHNLSYGAVVDTTNKAMQSAYSHGELKNGKCLANLYGFLSKQQRRFKLLEPAHIQAKLPWEGQRHHIMQIMDWFSDGMDIDAAVFKSDLKSLDMAVKMYGTHAPAQQNSGMFTSNYQAPASGYGQQARDANKTCFACGLKGHVKANCTKTTGGRAGSGAGAPKGPKKCFKCGQVGHIQAACPN